MLSLLEVIKILAPYALRSLAGEPGFPPFPLKQVVGVFLLFISVLFLLIAGCSVM